MFQRSLRWNAVGVVFALVLVLSLVTPVQAQARESAGRWQVTVLLQSWWSGLWASPRTAATGARTVDPAPIRTKRTSAVDPNGGELASPVLLRTTPTSEEVVDPQ